LAICTHSSTSPSIWNVGGAGIALADPSRVEPHNRALLDAARAIDSWTYAEDVKRTQHLSRRIVEAFVTSFDLLVTPTMACLPPPVGALRAGADDDPLMALLNSYPMAVFTSLFNVTGHRRSPSRSTTTTPPACP
jgi:amidase